MDLKKELSGVAKVAAQIMGEQLKGQQHQIDKNKNNKIDAHDFAILRGEKKAVKKEEVELTQDEAEMLASLTQEEFDSLTEEEQDLFIEYFQPLDEISTNAAKNYLKKAVSSSSKLNQKSAKPGEAEAEKLNYSHENAPYETKQFQKFSKRRTGIRRAINKLASAHPDNKKLATTARQAFNKMHNANYRIGLDGAKNHPKDVEHIKKQHAIIHKAVHAMKEEVEQIDELSKTTLRNYLKGSRAENQGGLGTAGHMSDKARSLGRTEQDKEDSRYEGAKTAKRKLDAMKEEVEQEEESFMTFSEMLAAYKEHGLAVIAEEPTEEEFNDEIKKAQAKSEGKEKADVAKASVQAVKQEEIEVLDADVINGVEEVTIDERSMTKPEMEKREDIVKGMKKKMSGFKERYGDRAKNVMYATATKQAMK